MMISVEDAVRQELERPVNLLVPVGIDPRELLPKEYGYLEDKLLYPLHVVWMLKMADRRFRDHAGEGVPLHTGVLNKVLGRGSYVDVILKALVEHGWLRITDPQWITGRKSKHYDFGPAVGTDTEWEWYTPACPSLTRSLRQHRAEGVRRLGPNRLALRHKLAELELDSGEARRRLALFDPDQLPEGIDRIGPEEWAECVRFAIRCMEHPDRTMRFYGPLHGDRVGVGRIYTVVTNMPGAMRSLLTWNTRPLVNLDISNSQPSFLAILAVERYGPHLPPDVIKYRDLCQQGRLYEYLMEKTEFLETRDEFKVKLYKRVFYGKPRSMTGPLADVFRREFPSIWALILAEKEGGHERLAIRMQDKEAEFVIDTVVPRILADPELAATPLATVHDSFLVDRDTAGRIREICDEESTERWGFRFNLKTTEHKQENRQLRPNIITQGEAEKRRKHQRRRNERRQERSEEEFIKCGSWD